MWDEIKEEFNVSKPYTLQLEHSLVSVSKWESKWCVPFLHTPDKSKEQILDYIKCMTITQNVPDEVYERLSEDNIEEIQTYIDSPMTAATFSQSDSKSRNGEFVTTETIYYSMFVNSIPMECQKWHLNRLLTLIKFCNVKNSPPKKMSRAEILRRNEKLNAERRAKYNSTG